MPASPLPQLRLVTVGHGGGRACPTRGLLGGHLVAEHPKQRHRYGQNHRAE